jgi:hypothetical protein
MTGCSFRAAVAFAIRLSEMLCSPSFDDENFVIEMLTGLKGFVCVPATASR